jgi:hypothetical protein
VFITVTPWTASVPLLMVTGLVWVLSCPATVSTVLTVLPSTRFWETEVERLREVGRRPRTEDPLRVTGLLPKVLMVTLPGVTLMVFDKVKVEALAANWLYVAVPSVGAEVPLKTMEFPLMVLMDPKLVWPVRITPAEEPVPTVPDQKSGLIRVPEFCARVTVPADIAVSGLALMKVREPVLRLMFDATMDVLEL